MDTRILKSILTIAVVAVLGVGVTFAAFTSDTVTISGNHLETGTANLAVCNGTSESGWTNSIDPSLSLDDLTPGDTDKELTAGTNLYIGNDGGELNDNSISGCGSYESLAVTGDSNVAMQLRPKVSTPNCDATSETLEDLLSIKFQFDDANDTGYKTLEEWSTNTDLLPPILSPDDDTKVTVFAQLDSAATEQGVSCDFDITFEGEQVTS